MTERGTRRESERRNSAMNDHRQSDRQIVPMKSPNKERKLSAEEREGSWLPERNEE